MALWFRLHARRPTSLALRMAIGYALSAFVLIFVAVGILYLVLVLSMYQEDVRDLADNLNNARLLLRSLPGEVAPPVSSRPAWAPLHQPQIYLRVLDADGRTLVETPGMSAELPAPPSAELVSTLEPDGVIRQVTSRSGKPLLALIVPVFLQHPSQPVQYMQAAMDRDHDDYLLAIYRQRLWFVLGAALILCFFVGYLLARAGMRPIEAISDTAERIRSTTLHERIGTIGLSAELSVLATTFNNMLDRLEESFQRISRFSDDVAHELRTPINNLRGEIEVALSRARSSEDYREVMGSCLEECTRISRVIQSLLFLARAERAGDLNREDVDVGVELAKVQDFYGAAATEAGIDLRITGAENLRARLDRTLFGQAVANLVSNAIAHTSAGGTVDIAARMTGNDLFVSVTDTGCGIAPEHLPRVCDRFYRVDKARSNSAQNVGLGLAVVKSIVARHAGRVEIVSQVGHGTCVGLVLPVKPPSEAGPRRQPADDDFVISA
jgi:two-component system heavy metal sensor histidine kinase CusS